RGEKCADLVVFSKADFLPIDPSRESVTIVARIEENANTARGGQPDDQRRGGERRVHVRAVGNGVHELDKCRPAESLIDPCARRARAPCCCKGNECRTKS